MKTTLFRTCFLVCCLVVVQLVSQRVWAQTATASMSLDQLKAIKAIKVGNLEKDTYFKSGDYILDRYEERPAYVFNYSDGIPRKIYLYKVFTAADTKELGLLAVYENGKTKETKPFVIPGASADRKAWDAYIDDLKYVGEKEAGLMSALGFVLSREMALLMGGGGSKEEGGDKKKEEYNFCFPADAVVTLADRQTQAIQDVKAGDEVMAYDAKTRLLVPTRVQGVTVHEKPNLAIAGVWVVPVEEISASVSLTKPVLLEATANHPVQTATGAKKLGDLRNGDVLYRFDGATKSVAAWKVASVQSNLRTVEKVYNLTTEKGSYLINDVVVLDK
ncbi:Hint domain-containing protein [Larkinella insperata]|uniref:Hint domain-containing protein n=1 Tax=Larkinella insperata TaxID=332158 RepID=A0ABW3QKJ5_9BACT|nr:Hint domain-containing protein [Larkinella insperata]